MSGGAEGPPPEGARAPSEEELARALAEQLGRIPVRDVLFQSMATFVDMAGIRLGLGPEGGAVRDLQQARQAIETLRALVSVAERELGAAQTRPFREPLASLQMAYARAIEDEPGAEGEGEEGGGPPPRRPDGPGQDPASRLWVPPGARR